MITTFHYQRKKMEQAKRFNKGKLRWGLVDFEAVGEMVKVLEAGAIKYGPDNWKKGLNREEILESIQRHLISTFEKEEVDQELGTYHIANIMANCMFYLYHHRNDSFSDQRNNPFVKQEIEKKA